MSDDLEEMEISLPEREALIKGLPCFSMLDPEQTRLLASYMDEKHFTEGDTIVSENDLIECVYIIVKGDAVVSQQQLIKKKKIVQTILGTLHAGESIGLNDTGFFSATGKRTATVTAATDMILLSLSLNKLLAFFKEHPDVQNAMQALTNQLLRVSLIKQSLPFHRLSHERLMWLANQVEEITFSEGEIIFNEGDVGDYCYLIRRGKVEIVTKDEQGENHQLAVLFPPTLFGEATLITRAPRNATAIALENTEILALKQAFLSELIETEKNVASMFMTLMVDRSRPAQNPGVTLHPREAADGQDIFILKNPDNGNYFKLSAQGFFIWEQLNGQQTMQEITLSLADEFDVFAPDVVAGLISKLAKAGFVEQVEIDKGAVNPDQPAWVKMMLKARKILESRVAIGDADRWLTKAYDKGIYLFFSRLGEIALGVFALLGILAFGFATNHIVEVFKTIHDAWLLILLLIPAMIVQTMLHEFGHAFATKAFGYEVHYMGVGWYWLGPIAFTDTSDMWLSTRGPRTVVNLAGICMDLILAAFCAILIFVVTNLYVQGFLWIFALFTYISAFRMLSPLQELDGYYLLMDLLERPHLRQNAVMWLVKVFPKSFRQPSLFKAYKPEIFYWLACILFLILVSLLTLFIQSFVFKILNIHSSNPLISLALPFLVVLISSLTIIADIRNQAE